MKASTAFEKLICRDGSLSKLDAKISYSYFYWVSRLSGDKKTEAREQQLKWLKDVQNLCNPLSFDAKACVERKYDARARDLNSYATIALKATCGAERVTFSFGPRAEGDASPEIVDTSDCTLANEIMVRARRSGFVLRVWVDRRLAAIEEIDYEKAGRVEVDGEKVVSCWSGVITDERAEDGLRCRPVADSHSAGRIDYAEFPPDPAQPKPDEMIVTYARDATLCRAFVQDRAIVVPRPYLAIPWDRTPDEMYGDNSYWDLGDWTGAVRIRAPSGEFVLIQSEQGQYNTAHRRYGALLASRGGHLDVACRFSNFGEFL